MQPAAHDLGTFMTLLHYQSIHKDIDLCPIQQAHTCPFIMPQCVRYLSPIKAEATTSSSIEAVERQFHHPPSSMLKMTLPMMN